MIPERLTIRGKLWRVVVDDLGPDIDGSCEYARREIRISSRLRSKRDVLDTFLHELLHACRGPTQRNVKIEERIVSEITPELLRVLQRIGWAP